MTNRRKHPRARRLAIEQLESRQMLSLQSALTTALIGLTEGGNLEPPAIEPLGGAHISWDDIRGVFDNVARPQIVISSAPSGRESHRPELRSTLDPNHPSVADSFRLAIYGDGFFIVQGPRGERYYTREPGFRINDDFLLVTDDGLPLLGYGVDGNFDLDQSQLVPLSVPLELQSSRPTSQAFIAGVLTPTADFADRPEILESVQLFDGANSAVGDSAPALQDTLLVDVVVWTDSEARHPFQPGILSFGGQKRGRPLDPRELAVDATTTVGDLMEFLDAALGIHHGAPGEISPNAKSAGVDLIDGRMRVTSNLGIENALSIGANAFEFKTTTDTIVLPLGFARVQAAIGPGSTTDFIVYDQQGVPLRVTITTALVAKDGSSTTYRWWASSPDHAPSNGSVSTIVGSGDLMFNGSGTPYVGVLGQLLIEPPGAAEPLEIALHFDDVSGLAVSNAFGESSSKLVLTKQNGFPIGSLTEYVITEMGVIRGVFDTGLERTLGQIPLASFADPYRLMSHGEGLYSATRQTGSSTIAAAGTSHLGLIVYLTPPLDVPPNLPPYQARYPWDLRTLKLAIEGEGYFVVEDAGGQQLYTRNGSFHLNAQQQLVNDADLRLLGFGVDDDFTIDFGQLVPQEVAIGLQDAVATQRVTLGGVLSIAADVGETPGIVESPVLGDAALPFPVDPDFGPDDFSVLPRDGGSGLGSGNYSYHITFYNTQTGVESRPSHAISILSLVTEGARVRIENIPQPATGDFDAVRVYRRESSGRDMDYHLVTTLPAGQTTFVDDVSGQHVESSPPLDLIGPKAGDETRLVDVVLYDHGTYQQPFTEGVLTFFGERGGRSLAARQMVVDESTTLGDLVRFMDQSLGIQHAAPAPGGLAAGGSIVGGRMRFVSNLGIENRLNVSLSSLTLRSADEVPRLVVLPFQQVQLPNGPGSTTELVVFDAAGETLHVRLSTVLEAKGDWGATYRWFAASDDNQTMPPSAATALATGTIHFNAEGQLTAGGTAEVTIDRTNSAAVNHLSFELDFSRIIAGPATNEWGHHSSIILLSQDGYLAGTLQQFIVSESGLLTGIFTNGAARPLGHIQLASFDNPRGLQHIGGGVFTATAESRRPHIGTPGEGLLGTLVLPTSSTAAHHRPDYRPPAPSFGPTEPPMTPIGYTRPEWRPPTPDATLA